MLEVFRGVIRRNAQESDVICARFRTPAAPKNLSP